VGADEPVNDPSSVFFFRDHLTFLDQVMRPEHREMGLLDVANQLEAKQRTFAEAKGIKLYGQLDKRLNLHGALTAAGSEAICHSKILEDHAGRKALWERLQFALDGEPDPWFEQDKALVDTRQFEKLNAEGQPA